MVCFNDDKIKKIQYQRSGMVRKDINKPLKTNY